MKKEVILIFVLIFLVSAGVFAQSVSNSLNEDVENYVKDFVKKSDLIKEEEITGVVQVNQSELPDDVEIKSIEENKVGIYEVNFTQNNVTKKVFVVTYATTQLKKKESFITKNIQNLYFGYTGISEKASYLEVSGNTLSKEKGYVMLRSGSITGISTSSDLTGDGKIFISVYKNGENTGFHNLIISSDNKKIDFDLQSENIVSYEPGDVIGVYVETSGDVNWGNVITIVETTS